MCSIMSCYKSSVTPEEFRAGFERTKSRGPDESRIEEAGDVLMAFHRLAIMGLTPEGMQPFERDGSLLVCNGEIYGFRALRDDLIKKGYRFESDSDCEILLPLWFEYGVDMFPLLDAEFACVFYDARTGDLIAARDPIGIRPLFYGYGRDGKILFASEAKNLVGLTEKVIPFPPGCYYRGGEFVRYADPAYVGYFTMKNEEDVCQKLRRLLMDGVRKRLDADAPIGFLLSGGLDSSLVCAIAQKILDKPIKTFAIGMDVDAIDLKYA
ncbi:MAG: asparagine synthetase B, partial [Clostridia bacterium]|nr:asparagine synthetase B [Clostridia bacterium]